MCKNNLIIKYESMYDITRVKYDKAKRIYDYDEMKFLSDKLALIQTILTDLKEME